MIKLSDISITTWCAENNIVTDAGKPLYFKGDRKFLFKPFSDVHDKIVILKAAQIGMSTISIIKALWTAYRMNLSIIYTFPTSDLMQKFVQGKINPLIDINPILKQLVNSTDNTYQKRIGTANIIFSGAEKESQAIAFSADILIHDELDTSKQNIIKQFQSRLQASRVKWQWLFSHPSLPEFGVHAKWQISDQKHWFITCDCGKEQYLSWPESIDIERKVYQCKECKKEITNEQRAKGRWVAKYKISEERPWSGYWIPLMVNPQVSAKEIIEYSKGDQYTFFTRVLGLPYTQGGDKVNLNDILKNCIPDVNDQEGRIVIGVDTGLPIWYVVGNRQGIFYKDSCKDYEPLKALMRRYPTAIMVIDQGGDLIGSRQMRELFPGRVFLCHYLKDRKTLQLITWGVNDETGNVRVDRNRAIQLVIDEFRDKRIPLNGTEEEWYDVALHFTHIYRVSEENDLGVPESKWERFDDDHFVHCCFTAGTKIKTMQGDKNIEDIKVGDRVLTRKGYKEVVITSNRDAEVKDFGVFKATLDHPVYAQDTGFKALHSMLYCDIVTVCQKKKLFTKVLHFVDTLIQKIEQKEFTLSQIVSKEERVSGDFTKKFTKITLELSRKVLLFITKMAIHLITSQQTWKQCLVRSISQDISTKDLKVEYIKGRTKITSTISEDYHTLGEKLKKAQIGTKNTLSKVLFYLNPRNLYVRCVARIVQHWLSMVASIVQENAVQSKVQEIGDANTPTTGNDTLTNERVYNFEVKDVHEYFANDILVSNCVYWRVGMSKFGTGGAKIFMNDAIYVQESPEIMPDHEMKATDPKKIFQFEDNLKEDDWRN